MDPRIVWARARRYVVPVSHSSKLSFANRFWAQVRRYTVPVSRGPLRPDPPPKSPSPPPPTCLVSFNCFSVMGRTNRPKPLFLFAHFPTEDDLECPQSSCSGLQEHCIPHTEHGTKSAPHPHRMPFRRNNADAMCPSALSTAPKNGTNDRNRAASRTLLVRAGPHVWGLGGAPLAGRGARSALCHRSAALPKGAVLPTRLSPEMCPRGAGGGGGKMAGARPQSHDAVRWGSSKAGYASSSWSDPKKKTLFKQQFLKKELWQI